MTEDDAKTKWCPFARVHHERQVETDQAWGPFNRLVLNNDDTSEQEWKFDPEVLCVGSACMAWRVLREEVSGTDDEGFGYVRSAVTGGYCGLAGVIP